MAQGKQNHRATHEQFRGRGFLSLWLGNFADEDELDEYLEEQFVHDFGFAIYTPDGPEADVEEQPKDIDTLLRSYSRGETFADVAVRAANAQGWYQATTAVVFYNFKYDPAFAAPEQKTRLTFIGVFSYPGFG